MGSNSATCPVLPGQQALWPVRCTGSSRSLSVHHWLHTHHTSCSSQTHVCTLGLLHVVVAVVMPVYVIVVEITPVPLLKQKAQ